MGRGMFAWAGKVIGNEICDMACESEIGSRCVMLGARSCGLRHVYVAEERYWANVGVLRQLNENGAFSA